MTYLHNYLLNNSLRDSRKDILSIHGQIRNRKTNVVLFLVFFFLSQHKFLCLKHLF